jgi:hypothetical protein
MLNTTSNYQSLLPSNFPTAQTLGDLDKRSSTDKLFQLLIVEEMNKKSPNQSLGITTTLLTGTLETLKKKTSLEPLKLPSRGVLLHDKFLPINNQDQQEDEREDNQAKRYGVRMLLQARKLSQLITKSWLSENQGKDEKDNKKFRIIRKLFLTANLQPEQYDGKDIDGNEIKGINDLQKLNPSVSDAKADIILPSRLNWSHLRLSLLFAGQAYMKDDESGELTPLCEPILSTYEIVNLYAFKLVWNDFAAYREELIQPGILQVPPYNLVTVPYPPRPNTNEFTQLTDEMIQAWAYAEEGVPQGEQLESEKFPFYPLKGEPEDKVNYVVPPYPYLPLSCC